MALIRCNKTILDGMPAGFIGLRDRNNADHTQIGGSLTISGNGFGGTVVSNGKIAISYTAGFYYKKIYSNGTIDTTATEASANQSVSLADCAGAYAYSSSSGTLTVSNI